MTDMTEADREAFEAWWRQEGTFHTDEELADQSWHAALAHARGKQDGEAWNVSARESDGRTYLNLKRMDGVSVSFSCQTNSAIGETIASQVVKLFAEQYAAPPAESTEVARLRAIEKAALAWRSWHAPRDQTEAALCAALAAIRAKSEGGK